MAGSQPEAERFLKEHDIIKRMRVVQSEVLGCIACRWRATGEDDGAAMTYGYEIRRCKGFEAGTIYPIIGRLEEAGLLDIEHETLPSDAEKGRPPRRYLLPAETDLGQEFQRTLIAPETCNLTGSEVE